MTGPDRNGPDGPVAAGPVLIAGATGYIGRKLALRLAGTGIETRCMARRPESAEDLKEAGCAVVRGDVLERDGLDQALDGIRTAFYLVHSMGRGGRGDFAEADRRAAENFARAAKRAGVERIVYLGGLGQGGSRHLRSREETARTLAAVGIPLTYLRAAVVIGAGSESFRTIYWLVKRLPVMVTPRWTTIATQPIGITDVVEALARSLDHPVEGEIQLGGPDVTTYGGLMDEMARAIGRRPPFRIRVPLLSPGVSSLWVGLVTPVDVGVARPLIEGLTTETVVTDRSGMDALGLEPEPTSVAMLKAVEELDENGR